METIQDSYLLDDNNDDYFNNQLMSGQISNHSFDR